MRKIIFTLLISLCAVFSAINSNAQGTLIHYWHFNNFTTPMYTPFIVGIPADYSIHDTSKAKILFAELPGTSASYSTYIDPNPAVAADYDTVNARLGQPPGNMMRPRNPVDSMRLLFYIPSVHYNNLVFKYATQSSSVAHGDTYQDFDYSIDSGATWITSGLSELQDSAWLVMKLVTVAITNPLANDNPRLVFRLRFQGNTTLTSGNNRFDNVTLEGDSIIIASAITTTPTSFGPFCNTTTGLISVAYTTVGGPFTGAYSVQLSNSAGSFASGTTIIGSGSASPITASIPSGTAPGTYRLRVVSLGSTPAVYGTDNGSDIIVNGPPIAYTVTGGGTGCAGAGVPVGLSNSQVGASYQLYMSGSPVGTPVTGTGSAISFGNVTTGGTYYARATYTATAACNNTMAGTATVTLSPGPAAITGTTTVCAGQTINLHETTTGGTWSSSATTLATVTNAGVVTGVAAGTATISYTASACYSIATITINPLASITGVTNMCVGASTTLNDAITGGTWSSSSANVTVGSASGIVTGVNSGSTAAVIYTTPGNCQAITTVSVNPSPSAISGATAVCAAATTTLTNAATGGTWTSSNTGVATINSSGIVSGVAIGTTTISYVLPGGCATSLPFSVSLSPSAITSPSTICTGIYPLTDAVSGGVWSSSTSSIATIGSLTGIVSGIAPGTTTITYSLGTSCTVNKIVTINASPAPITGTTSICVGATAALADMSTGGIWASSTNVSISGTGIITGTGVGTALVDYTIGGCSATTTISVNMAPVNILGATGLCAGTTTLLTDASTGGNWSTANTNITISAGGLVSGVSAGTATVTYSIGSCLITKAITVNPVATMSGPTGVCIGATATLVPTVTGGTWVSAATATATVSGSGVVYGVTAGTTVITYALPTGCTTYTAVTVNTIPTAITGTLHTCVGATTTLGDGAGGGIWSISPTSRATVGVSSAVVTGVSAGTAAVTYSLGTGCTVTAVVTINPLPSPISGTTQVCIGLTTALADATTGGTWNSSTPSIATINTGGVAGGIVPGNDTVTYTIPTGCMATAIVTVNPLPGPVNVSGYVCLGLNTTLTDPSPGGTWSSSNTAQATINMTTGVVTGVSGGPLTITYTLPTTCITTAPVTVNAIAPPITGTLHVCEALTTTLRDTLPGGAWTSSDNTIATVNALGVVTGVSAGVITISYITAICPAAATLTVNAIPGPIGGVTEVCAGSYTTVSDAGGGTWSSSNIYIASVDPTTGSVRGQSAGTAIITYTLDVGCNNTTVVTVDPVPAAIAGASYTCLAGSLSLSEATTGGTWSSMNTGIAVISGSGHVTPVAYGSTIISYTIPNGCAATRFISVITVPAISGVGNVCAYGNSSLSLSDAVSGGTWTSSLVYVSDTGLVTTAAPGVASVTYTIAAGCSSTATFTVNPLPAAITGNTGLCTGLTTSLSDLSAGTWSSSNTAVATVNSSGLVGGVTAGTSIITFTNGSGCTETTTVNVHALPSIIAGATSICTGTTGSLVDATPGGAWSSSAASVATVNGFGVVSGVAAGLATITYDLGSSCIATTVITINASPARYTVTGGGAYCVGGSGVPIGLSSSFLGVNYQLYNGTTPVGDSIPGTYSNISFGLQTAAGTYAVIATNAASGCSTSMGGATVTIAPLPAIHTVTGGGNYCPGTTGADISLNTSDIGVHYQLYNGSATAGTSVAGTGAAIDFGQYTAGLYDVIATAAIAGCTAHMADTVAVIVLPSVIPIISVASAFGNVVCTGTATTFNTTITNGGATPVYEWAVNGVTRAGAAGASYTYTPVNGDIVKAILISSAQCAAPDTVGDTIAMTVQAIVMPTVTITATPGITITPGESVTLTATATNAGPSPTYEWALNGTVISGATASTYTSATFANGDVVTCIVTSNGSCPGQTANGAVTIVVNSHVGVQQLSSADNIRVIPNPSRGEFTISGSLGSATSENVAIEISNLLGQVIYKDVAITQNGEISKRVSINNNLIANGMYLITLYSGTERKVYHIVIEQ